MKHTHYSDFEQDHQYPEYPLSEQCPISVIVFLLVLLALFLLVSKPAIANGPDWGRPVAWLVPGVTEQYSRLAIEADIAVHSLTQEFIILGHHNLANDPSLSQGICLGLAEFFLHTMISADSMVNQTYLDIAADFENIGNRDHWQTAADWQQEYHNNHNPMYIMTDLYESQRHTMLQRGYLLRQGGNLLGQDLFNRTPEQTLQHQNEWFLDFRTGMRHLFDTPLSTYHTRATQHMQDFLPRLEAALDSLSNNNVIGGALLTLFGTDAYVTRNLPYMTGPNDSFRASGLQHAHCTAVIRTPEGNIIYFEPSYGIFIYQNFTSFTRAMMRAYTVPNFGGETMPSVNYHTEHLEPFDLPVAFTLMSSAVSSSHGIRQSPDPVVPNAPQAGASAVVQTADALVQCQLWQPGTGIHARFKKDAESESGGCDNDPIQISLQSLPKRLMDIHSDDAKICKDRPNCADLSEIIAAHKNSYEKLCLGYEETTFVSNLSSGHIDNYGYTLTRKACNDDDDHLNNWYFTYSGQIVTTIKSEDYINDQTKWEHHMCLTDNSREGDGTRVYYVYDLQLCDATSLGQRWQFERAGSDGQETFYQLVSGLHNALGYVDSGKETSYARYLFTKEDKNNMQLNIANDLYQFNVPLTVANTLVDFDSGESAPSVYQYTSGGYNYVYLKDFGDKERKPEADYVYYNLHTMTLFFFDHKEKLASCFKTYDTVDFDSWDYVVTKRCHTAKLFEGWRDDNTRWEIKRWNNNNHSGYLEIISLTHRGDGLLVSQGKLRSNDTDKVGDNYLFVSRDYEDYLSKFADFFAHDTRTGQQYHQSDLWEKERYGSRYSDLYFIGDEQDFTPIRPRVFDYLNPDQERPIPVWRHGNTETKKLQNRIHWPSGQKNEL